MSRYSCALLLVLTLVTGAFGSQGEIPFDDCLAKTDPAPCVEFEDASGGHWFLASIASVHPALGELPIEPGTSFRVTGTYCESCVQTFCGTFDGFIFNANLVPCLEGDVNADGQVSFSDLLEIIGSWGPCGATPESVCPADVNTDGEVDFGDLLAVLANWG